MIKLSRIILSSIIALAPLKVFAQSTFNGFPQWAKNRGTPSYVKVHSNTYFTFAVDRQYVLLNNGNYGVILYSMSHNKDPLFSRTYYEFNCQTGRYSFQGDITGELINGVAENVKWIEPCQTEICQGFTRIDDDVLAGIKKHCPL